MASATVKATRALVSLSTRADARSNSCKTAVLPSLPTPSQFSCLLVLHKAASCPGRPPLLAVKACGKLSPCLREKHQLKLSQNFLNLSQLQWDRLEDKYFVTSLAFASLIALYGSVGVISAIDRLPLLPGIFEIIGIGYSGWFAYNNLVFKPDRLQGSFVCKSQKHI
ncbi:hypothetical protein HPP92_021951 [Vanilla planifolia]|uniref:Cyanobacterial aminoacyl-tRNA synthetase CAAD domain-containing protein n=1 Tax=Vanilla planifolia TaxID=51239 RepID=A0A835PXA1_VANPL|nr:hypothetical protein HPP92_021951 [Vanilla planifolia]